MSRPKYKEYDHEQCLELMNLILDYQANEVKNQIRREDNERALTQLKIELGEVKKAKEWVNSLPFEKIGVLEEMEGALIEAYKVLSQMNYNPDAKNIHRLHHGVKHALEKAEVEI